MNPIEFMVSEDDSRLAFANGTPAFKQQVVELKKRFKLVNEAGWMSVSTPQYNPIYDDNVVSVVFQAKPAYLDNMRTAAIGRKYFMKKGWVYDKIYTFIAPGTNTLSIPEGALPMFVGKLINVYGQPGDEDLTRYRCIYFMHKDHAAVEAWAGKTLPQGEYSTFYAATFDVKAGKTLLRVKTYCYDEQGGFSDWDVIYYQHCKLHGVVDELLV